MLFRNTAGKKDAILTMAVFAMAIILIKVLLDGVVITVAGNVLVNFGTVDSGIIGALLTPTLSAYVARRYTEHKFKAIVGDEPVDVDDAKGANNANPGQS